MSLDIVVVGAGLPGLLAAWRLAESGMKVAVFERGRIGSESSSLAAGHVPQDSMSRENLALLRRTREIIDELDRITGGVTRFNVVGGIQLATGQDGAEGLHNRAQLSEEVGGIGDILEPHEIARRFPQIYVEDLVAGYYTTDDGFVRSLDLTTVLGSMARAAGVDIGEGCLVERVCIDDGSVKGVIVGGELVKAPRVLVSAGAWSRPLLERSGVLLPTKSFVLQALMLVGVSLDIPFISEVEGDYYVMVRTPSTVLLGIPPRNFDIDPDRFSRDVQSEDQLHFLDLVTHRIPMLRAARPAGGWAGVLVATPDAWPLLGPFGPDGLFVATGLGGGGLQRLSGAEAVAQLIMGEMPFVDLVECAASRFKRYDGQAFEFREKPFYYAETSPMRLR